MPHVPPEAGSVSEPVPSVPRTAADIMTEPVVSVAPETSVRDVAKLLTEKHISAVPVVDKSGDPIGMVSEGDLLGRGKEARLARRDWWLEMLSHAGETDPGWKEETATRPVREVMHAPVLTVEANAPVQEVAEMLRSHRIKRVPVMRNGRMVGIVSRADLLRAVELIPKPAMQGAPESGLVGLLMSFFGGQNHRAGSVGPHAQPVPVAGAAARPSVSAGAFRSLVKRSKQAEIDQKKAAAQAAELDRQRRIKDMLQEHIDKQMWETLVANAQAAAAHGATEFQLLRFPSGLCSDNGRKIDVAEAGWPETLRGEAADLYDRWERELKPAGFGLSARILDYPQGKPGDIGLFLTWGADRV